ASPCRSRGGRGPTLASCCARLIAAREWRSAGRRPWWTPSTRRFARQAGHRACALPLRCEMRDRKLQSCRRQGRVLVAVSDTQPRPAPCGRHERR
ncbi:hypothetical protein EMIHUDRAFT_365734, partial [Emiliania huxleyi CCMP1516]|uniref:Uncharacterized protein n=2 Tax=Emiliania huxleyi TaxID=2903 RepID=A0A0D3K1Q6_EMIH1